MRRRVLPVLPRLPRRSRWPRHSLDPRNALPLLSVPPGQPASSLSPRRPLESGVAERSVGSRRSHDGRSLRGWAADSLGSGRSSVAGSAAGSDAAGTEDAAAGVDGVAGDESPVAPGSAGSAVGAVGAVGAGSSGVAGRSGRAAAVDVALAVLRESGRLSLWSEDGLSASLHDHHLLPHVVGGDLEGVHLGHNLALHAGDVGEEGGDDGERDDDGHAGQRDRQARGQLRGFHAHRGFEVGWLKKKAVEAQEKDLHPSRTHPGLKVSSAGEKRGKKTKSV